MGLIEIRDVSKHFGEKVALDHVSIDIPKGTIYGLLGPNGAGKTTAIRIINRITIPNSGEVFFDGRRITDEEVVFENGDLVIPDRPGLGIEVNEEVLAEYPYHPRNLRHYTGNVTDIRPKGDTVFYFKGLENERF